MSETELTISELARIAFALEQAAEPALADRVKRVEQARRLAEQSA